MGINQPQRTASAMNGVNKLLSACTLVIGIGLIIVMLSCLIFFAIPRTAAQSLWQTSKARWVSNGSSNYTFFVEIGGGMAGEHHDVIDVLKGSIVVHPCAQHNR